MVAISSMTSRGYVSHQMLRSLCCRSNKVDGVEDTAVIMKGSYVDTVFVFFSENILGRSLLGKFISALEGKSLSSQAIEFRLIDPNLLKNSLLFKNFRGQAGGYGVFCIWKGQDAFKRVEEAISRTGNEFSVNKADVLYTTTATQTKKEAALWITPPPADTTSQKNKKKSVENQETNEADAPPVEAADDATANGLDVPATVITDENGVTSQDDNGKTPVDENIMTSPEENGTSSVPAGSDQDTAETEAARTPTPPPPVPHQEEVEPKVSGQPAS